MSGRASCSGTSAALGEPLAGTAGHTLAWLLVEQPGPWGRVALRESRLDPEIGAALEARCAAAGVKPFLVKRPGRDRERGTRTVLAVSSHPGNTWVRRLELERPEELLRLDLAALARGEPPGGEPAGGPLFLVCTNGRRDACCARAGRPIAAALAGVRPEATWECSHTGGHRFAGVMICLPDGICYGRLGPPAALSVAEAYGERRVDTAFYRGRTPLDGAAQAAEVYLRRAEGIERLDALAVESAADGSVVLRRSDGPRFRVRVRLEPAEPPRAASCRDIGVKERCPDVWRLVSIERI